MWREWRVTRFLRGYTNEQVVAQWVSVGRLRKRWNDTVKDCLKKRGVGVRQAKRMAQDRSEWRGFVRRDVLGVVQGMNP